MSTAIAILEPCPKAKKVKSLIARREVFKFKCKVLCPYCKGKGSVMTCPDCDGCGLRLGVPCQRCGTRGKLPGQLSEE